MKSSTILLYCLAMVLTTLAIAQQSNLKIDYEKYTLANGLEVILHEDRSDPITAVAILFHVGSNREEVGRTGFAHLFEHMLFQESQHVGQDQFFQKIQNAGGTLNGGTWEDGTIYYEVVPKNTLEMVLWMESDRMGYLLPTVTQEAFMNQQDVVQNEKRQRVDNVPYGHTNYVIKKLLYPESHPYNWEVIGSFEDLKNATIEDIHKFYQKWYGPNNATLVIAGDFDKAQTRQWVQKYFGELKPGPNNPDPNLQPVTLSNTKRAFHEDNFAQSPELNMVFPSAKEFSKDAYALDLLADLLADGKKAPLYKVLVEDQKLAPGVSARQSSSEIAGEFSIRVRSFPQVDLDDVEQAIANAFTRFETEKFSEEDLARIKARTETSFYNNINSVFLKAFQLAYYNEYAGSPDYITRDIQQTLDVTTADIWRVYNTYIKDKPYVMTGFVPIGKIELSLENAERFPVVEEPIEGDAVAGDVMVASDDFKVEKLGSSFDRSIEPPKGPIPATKVPKIWTHSFDNGLKLYGVQNGELPMVDFALTIKGGSLMDNIDTMGVANLISDIMMEGTRNKTPLELQEAIEKLGASIRMSTGRESITLSANTLASRLPQVYTLFEEILMEPRWDEKEYARIQQQTIEEIQRSSVNPQAVAGRVIRKLVYGQDNILGQSITGDEEDVNNITMDDLKSFYAVNFNPGLAYITIVGDVSDKEAVKLFKPLGKRWKKGDARLPLVNRPAMAKTPMVYFVDIPNAKQSQIYIGHPGIAEAEADFYPATVMNYKLGGSFTSILNLILREEKGYTYGARSTFTSGLNPGFFIAYAGVQSKFTLESVQIFKEEIEKYRNGVTAEDLEFTRNALVQSNARNFETLSAKRGMIDDIAMYGLPVDYVNRREQLAKTMTLERHKELAQKYIHPESLVYVIVGDAATQAARLQELGLGEPIMLDTRGNRIESE